MRKIKIIDLLCLISNGEEVPKKVKYKTYYWEYKEEKKDYKDNEGDYVFSCSNYDIPEMLNNEVEILDDEEDKDIPLIPDDELYQILDIKAGITNERINYNFKVLQEKINQVVEEFNEYRKDHE